MSENGENVTVWRASEPLRIFSSVAVGVLVILAVVVGVSYGYVATIGIVLVLAAAFQVWWIVLRPRLSVGPDGVEVVAMSREPVRLGWRDIRRCEVVADGLKIVGANGREVISRFPARRSEAERVAAYLGQRAAWARRPSGTPPRYVPDST
jgi:hypothetical protein